MNSKRLSQAEILLIVIFALFPLFITLPYHINIFLSWEGAYRMSHGQIPFRDFGSPIGGVYWIVPAVFFKIFGPLMISLIKAQVFINIVSGFAFRSILNSLKFNPKAKFISVVIFILSYSFINFWPWYNHSVIVYELIGLSFLLKHMYREKYFYLDPQLIFSSFFSVCAFLTKQDAGAMAIIICGILLLYISITEHKWASLFVYIIASLIFTSIYIFATDSLGFKYWFNYGQPPHNSRVHLSDLTEEFLSASQWIKFYMFLMIILSFKYLAEWKNYIKDKKVVIPILLTFGILTEAVIFAVTSYVPPDNNIFFHAFAIGFILNAIIDLNPVIQKSSYFITTLFLVLLWWSPNYWKYTKIIFKSSKTKSKSGVTGTENIVDRNSYIRYNNDMGIPADEWKTCSLATLNRISLPSPTIDGIFRIKQLDVIRNLENPVILNMSELTTLAVEIPYKLETGRDYPLWFHLGVGMFNKQAEMFENRISNSYYDLVLFEYIPSLNNFYPFRIRNKLLNYYSQIDSFPAPRNGETQGIIEVFQKKQIFESR
jgi:hypothetical protein